MDRDPEKITIKIIEDNFHLQLGSDDEALKKIRGLLIDKLDFLIAHDFEKLLSILYRIDVSERKVKEALAAQTDRNPSELLADLIIERQMEKANTRAEYGHRSDQDSNDYNPG